MGPELERVAKCFIVGSRIVRTEFENEMARCSSRLRDTVSNCQGLALKFMI